VEGLGNRHRQTVGSHNLEKRSRLGRVRKQTANGGTADCLEIVSQQIAAKYQARFRKEINEKKQCSGFEHLDLD
jgi:hypothetical protein